MLSTVWGCMLVDASPFDAPSDGSADGMRWGGHRIGTVRENTVVITGVVGGTTTGSATAVATGVATGCPARMPSSASESDCACAPGGGGATTDAATADAMSAIGSRRARHRTERADDVGLLLRQLDVLVGIGVAAVHASSRSR